MQPKQYNKASFYYSTPITSWNSLDLWVPREIPRDGTDEYITLDQQYSYRPDVYSYVLYGTSQYCWVFMMMNKDVIKNPIYDFVGGIQIYIPTVEKLSRILG